MKIVLLCGSNANHKALACKLSLKAELVGIVIDEKKTLAPKRSLASLSLKIWNKIKFGKIDAAWHHLMQYYQQKYPDYPNVPTQYVPHINDAATINFIHQHKPDLVMVSGTMLLRKPLLSQLTPSKGIINLHTGLSPYIKGGPNCTNWCLANNDFHLIGNTIMWIDSGIDTGNIISTEFTKFDGSENLQDIHLKVMEHAHELYIKSITTIQNNFEQCPSVKQDSLDKGKLFYTKMWKNKQKRFLLKNLLHFKEVVTSETYHQKQKKIKVVKLP